MSRRVVTGSPTLSIPSQLRWASVGVVAVLILYWSVVVPPLPDRHLLGPFGLIGVDTWAHLSAYAGLAAALAVAYRPSRRSDLWTGLVVVGLPVTYGFAIELLQLAVPVRQFSLFDGVANGVGAGLVGIGWLLYRRAADRNPGETT